MSDTRESCEPVATACWLVADAAAIEFEVRVARERVEGLNGKVVLAEHMLPSNTCRCRLHKTYIKQTLAVSSHELIIVYSGLPL